MLESTSLSSRVLKALGWLPVVLLPAVLCGALWPPRVVWSQVEIETSLDRAAIDREFYDQLLGLASACQRDGQTAAAKQIRRWFITRDPGRQYLFTIPPGSEADAEMRGGSADDDWHGKFMSVRRLQAQRLWTLAERALQQGQMETAYQLVHEILREDPVDPRAARIAGVGSTTGTTPPSPTPVTGRRRDPQFGWPPKTYWRLRTPHFLITTNHSPAAARLLADQLEQTQQVWRQMFVRLWTDRRGLQRAFEGGSLPRRSRLRHHVVLFRDRDEYLRRLEQREPQISMTTGVYRERDRTAYFYMADEPLTATWRHELAHQLFCELSQGTQRAGESQNFWVVEGIALYLESLIPAHGYCTVGGWDASRLQFARYRVLNENFYVPLAELVNLGRQQLQHDQRIRKLYSQSAGLTHLLMDGAGCRYRTAVVDLLSRVYQGTDTRHDLSTLTGQTTDTIDEQYRHFLIIDDEQLRQLHGRSHVRQLCLGHTAVTDIGLAHLADLHQIQWLDLAACDVTDVGILALPAAPLRQLNLESTGITDRGVASLSRFPDLEELDLTDTRITDEAITTVAQLNRLQVLWLTGTQITDTGVRQLHGLTRLRRIDVSGTKVTAAAWRELQAALPLVNPSADHGHR